MPLQPTRRKHSQRHTLRVRFTKTGRYYYFCPVDNHVLYGMAGYLRVIA